MRPQETLHGNAGVRLESIDPLSFVDGALPRVLLRVASLVGNDAAAQLAIHYGGETIEVPNGKGIRGPSKSQVRLESTVGVEAAQVLMSEFGGRRLYVPRCANARIAHRNKVIAEQFTELFKKMSALRAVAQLVSEHRISDRSVWDIVRAAGAI